MEIPKQLQNPDFRFVFCGRWDRWFNLQTKEKNTFTPEDYSKIDKKLWKPLGKSPFQKDWQTQNNYTFNSPALKQHIQSGRNFGIIGGYGNLRILDIDDKELAKEFYKKTNTLTIQTGSGGMHFYFISNYNINHVLANEKGELRAKNYQVIAPGCKHPSGRLYKIIRDVPIQNISPEDLADLIMPFIRQEKTIENSKAEKEPQTEKQKDTSRSGLEFRRMIALFRSGKTREEVIKEMQAYNKFVSSSEQYRQHQLDNAEKFVLDERGKTKETNNNSDINSCIFDDDEILKPKAFSMHLLNNDLFCYGVKLPKNETLTIKHKGKTEHQIVQQVWKPAIIKSDNTGELLTENFKNKYKVFYEVIPTENNTRWSLSSIKNYKDKNYIPIDKEKLYNKIKNQYKKFLKFNDEEWYDIHTLWDIGTYCFMLFSNYPIMDMGGITGSGKTKVMTLSSFITFNATEKLINPSESTLFRLTDELRPTKYIDEAENLFVYNPVTKQLEPDNRAQLINESYGKGGKVPRQEKNGNQYITKFYSCYSPTMLGSIKGLIGATETRAITHIMTKNPSKDERGNLEIEDFKDEPLWQEIRDELYIFTMDNWKEIIRTQESIDFKQIAGRNKQLWKPLLTLAKFFDDELFNNILKFADTLSAQKNSDIISDDSLLWKILKEYHIILKNKTAVLNEEIDNRVYVYEIADKLNNSTSSSRIGNKTISNHLDKIGLKQFRYKDTNRGSFFEINYNRFKEIIEPSCPQLFQK